MDVVTKDHVQSFLEQFHEKMKVFGIIYRDDIIAFPTLEYENSEEYIKENYKPADMLFKLANNYSIVLLSGKGFSGPEWSVRISLANLDDSAYKFIGKSIKEVLSYYVYSWKK